MGDINRWVPRALVPLALVALAACSQPGDPAQTVQRDAEAQRDPARPVSGAAPMQPAVPAEGVTRAEAVQLRRTSDGGVELRKVDALSGQGAEAVATEAQQH
ncbi:hypothetical protein [Stenotrophomonas maltophilia]|uniref:hypothetical protein n=1 Tax=Stenotrophomonas maltophilia TaxID=40324 RepID=UPI003876AFE8